MGSPFKFSVDPISLFCSFGLGSMKALQRRRRIDVGRERFLLESILNGFLAGAVIGGLEGLIGLQGPSGPAGILILQSVLLPIGIIGLCGAFLGGLFGILARLAFIRIPIIWKTGFVTILLLSSGLRYDPGPAGLFIVFSLILGTLIWKTGSEMGLIVFFLWGALLILLKPLFTGHAMDLVFTESQTLFLMGLTMMGLLGLSYFFAATWFRNPREGVLSSVGKGMIGILIALFLAIMDSIFLIRLWGYHTMEYLQGVFLLIGIGAVSLPCTLLIHRTRLRSPFSMKICTAVLLLVGISFVIGSTQNRDVVDFVLARSPHAGMFIQTASQLTDRDGDGFSSWFHFGDCDDSNPNYHPGTIDWPGNGIDENCFGGDLTTLNNRYFTLPVKVSIPDRKNDRRPKVAILVIIDTLRADKIDYRTGPESLTPTLGQVAESSVRFSRAYSQSNNTLESVPFFFQLGFRALPWNHSDWTLAHFLKKGGIRTAGVFQASVAEWWGKLGLGAMLFDFDEIHRPDPTVRNFTLHQMSDRAVEVLSERDPNQDLFLIIYFEALHDSFTQRMEGGRMIQQGLNIGEIVRLLNIDGMVAAMENRYLNILSGIDRSLSPIWQMAKNLESVADVMFIVTSDHGEEFYEHGGLFHLGTLYDETTRIPMMFHVTGDPSREVTDPVGSYRIPSTILRFFGYGGKHVALLNVLRRPLTPFPVFSYFSWRDRGDRRVYMIVDGDWKMIYHSVTGNVELYNLATDPEEHDDLSGNPSHGNLEQSLREQMDQLLFFMIYGDQFAFQHKLRFSDTSEIKILPNP